MAALVARRARLAAMIHRPNGWWMPDRRLAPRALVSCGTRRCMAALMWLAFAAPWCQEALAHSPHDDGFEVRTAPDFASDPSVYAIVRSNFMLSRDGGETWRRVVHGLDHKHILYSFDIAGDGKTLYLASLGDGVYRSSDAGNRWERANSGLSNKAIDLVKVVPGRPDHVIAAGVTGGLFRSTDGGNNWKEVSGDFGKVTALAFHPELTNQVVLGDHRGTLYQSVDAGASWALLYRPEEQQPVTSIAFVRSVAGGRQILFGTARGRLGRSDATYRQFSIEPGFPGGEAVVAIDVAPGSSGDGTVYATLWDEGVYCSTDDGLTWAKCASGLTRDRQSVELGRPSFTRLAVTNTAGDDRTLFLAGYDGIFISRNAGRSWHQLETLPTTNIVGLAVSPTHADDSTVFLTNWLWGAHVSHDGGRSWGSINDGAVDYLREDGVTRLFDILVSPDYLNDRTLFSSTWYRFLKSTDAGASWRQISMVDDGDWNRRHHGLVIAVSPEFRDDGTIYVGTHRGVLLKSADRGETFRVLKDVENVIGGLLVPAGYAAEGTVFAGDSHGVYRSTDGGNRWNFAKLVDDDLHFRIESSPVLPDEVARNWIADQYAQREKEFGIRLAASPAYMVDRTVFAGTPNGLFMTSDGGDSWLPVQSGGLDGNSFIESIAVSPDFANDRTVLVSARGDGLYRSIDGGRTYAPSGTVLLDEQIVLGQYVGMVPKFPGIVFSPTYADDKVVYGYSGRYLLRSADVGSTWEQLQAPDPGWFRRRFTKARYHYKQIIPGPWYRSRKVWVVILLAIGIGALGVMALRRRHRGTLGIPA